MNLNIWHSVRIHKDMKHDMLFKSAGFDYWGSHFWDSKKSCVRMRQLSLLWQACLMLTWPAAFPSQILTCQTSVGKMNVFILLRILCGVWNLITVTVLRIPVNNRCRFGWPAVCFGVVSITAVLWDGRMKESVSWLSSKNDHMPGQARPDQTRPWHMAVFLAQGR